MVDATAGAEGYEETHGEQPTRVVNGGQTSLRIGMNPPEPAPDWLGPAREGTEDSSQGALWAVWHGRPDVGVDFSGTQDGVSRQVDERCEGEQSPRQAHDRVQPLVEDRREEREHSDEEERVPQ